MGQEHPCKLTWRRRTTAGKAYLETDHLLFRGDERLKVRFEQLTAVTARGGLLELEFAEGPASFELGDAAEKWARKILNPPSRLDKLGVKPGLAIAVEGEIEPEFLGEIGGLADPGAKADLLFFAAPTLSVLSRTAKLASRLKASGALWIVYPKGNAAIREIDVIEAGRGAGLKDIKVVRFSATHTALKFVIPAAHR